jgi:hypothetical protein
MYSTITRNITDIVNSTVASVTEALSEVGSTVSNYVYTTTTSRPTRLYRTYTWGTPRLSTNYTSTVPFSTSTVGITTVTTPIPTQVTTTVAQWVNTTTEGGLVIGVLPPAAEVFGEPVRIGAC